MVDRRLLFSGDSFVAGVGDPTGRGWVGRVAEATFAAGLPVTTYNLGVRRETSLQVAARWWGEAQPRLMPGTDCRVVFLFGANDTTVEEGRLRAEPDQSRTALEDALTAAAQRGLRAFVVRPPPVGDGSSKLESRHSRRPTHRPVATCRCPTSKSPSRCSPPEHGSRRRDAATVRTRAWRLRRAGPVGARRGLAGPG